MSKKTFLIIAGVVIVVLAGAFFIVNKVSAPSPAADTSATEETANPAVNTATYDAAAGIPPVSVAAASLTVTYTDQGFSPKSLTVMAGDTVRFVNNSSHGMWVASASHPTHTQYDGTSLAQHCASGATPSFDACKAIAVGASYSFTFAKAGTFMYHNHVQTSDTGSIVVQ